MSGRKITPDQAQEIARRREAGWSYKRLATHFGVSPGGIHYQCLKQGAVSPRSRALGRCHRRTVAGFGRNARGFSEAEDLQLLQRARGGEKIDAIAAAMDRPRSSVRVRLMTLELRDEQEAGR